MKKSKIFSGIAMLLFLLSGWAAEYHVTCRITAPDLKKVMICDGERFHRVGSDGICEFTLNTECEPFLYLYFPDEMEADGAFTKALKPGKNEFSFTLKKGFPYRMHSHSSTAAISSMIFSRNGESCAMTWRNSGTSSRNTNARSSPFPAT